MKKSISLIALLITITVAAYNCSDKTAAPDVNKAAAKTYCGSCHLFPEAGLLDKHTWAADVLPPMGKLLGILYAEGQPYLDIHYAKDSNNNDVLSRSGISMEDWNRIVAYYQANAPDSLPGQGRLPVTTFTSQFITREVPLAENGFCAISYLSIDAANHWLYAANAFDSSLTVYDQRLKKTSTKNIHAALVDINFLSGRTMPGQRSGLLTNIGIMNPNDGKVGSVDSFSINAQGTVSIVKRILDSLPRPVQTTVADFNKDGAPDYLVCGFGNKAGALYIMYNKGMGKFERHDLRSLPGAIKAYITDVNRDGLPDVMALMTQAQEGIFLFVNKGNGSFDTKEVLRFPPVYGSSYFELDDFNKDGYPDILYTCGDNADYTPRTLKDFHGVYIFMNDGRNHFSQKYFYPIHGCFKAIARDFDKDGDLDISTISFFPDSKRQPTEGFIYLENKGEFNYTPSTIREVAEGRWLTMDAGDIDGDGYEDIVIGSLVPPVRVLVDKAKREKKKKAVLLLLHNIGKRAGP